MPLPLSLTLCLRPPQDLLNDLNIGSNKHRIMEMAVSLALERHDPQRELTSRLISDLYGQLLNRDEMMEGFHGLLSNLPDLTLDTPDAPSVRVIVTLAPTASWRTCPISPSTPPTLPRYVSLLPSPPRPAGEPARSHTRHPRRSLGNHFSTTSRNNGVYRAFVSQFVFHWQRIQEFRKFLNHRHHKRDRKYSDFQLKF